MFCAHMQPSAGNSDESPVRSNEYESFSPDFIIVYCSEQIRDDRRGNVVDAETSREMLMLLQLLLLGLLRMLVIRMSGKPMVNRILYVSDKISNKRLSRKPSLMAAIYIPVCFQSVSNADWSL